MAGQRKILRAARGMLLPWAISAALGIPAAFANGNPGLNGSWARDDGTVRMAISPCGGDLCAVNTWVKDPNGKEKIGDKLVMTLKPVSSSELKGQAYDVRRQMHYKMTVTLQDATTMQTSGCVLGIICKTVGWTRTN